jgi:hypothetical protein
MSTKEYAPLAVLASTDADYERYGVARERVEPFEDGARTDGRPGTYEWWYFDAHLEDGAKLVVDYSPVTLFMLAKDGKVVADDGTRTRFETDDSHIDPLTGKPVANVTRYRYEGDGETYVVTFTRHSDLTRNKMIDGDLAGNLGSSAHSESSLPCRAGTTSKLGDRRSRILAAL